jgi:hypothetical protein
MSLRFDLIHVSPNPDESPFTPFVHVRVSSYSTDVHSNIIVSPQLMTAREVDESVDGLILELNTLRAKAKRLLKS